jgi:hypothetical protein
MDSVAIEPLPAKCWKQRWVDVDYSIHKIIRDCHELEKSGHDDKVNFRFATEAEKVCTPFFERCLALRVYYGSNTCGLGNGHSADTFSVGKNQLDSSRKLTVFFTPQQVFEGPSGSR